jgi:serine/threonine-protein kinase
VLTVILVFREGDSMSKKTAVLLIGIVMSLSVLAAGCGSNIGNKTSSGVTTKTYESANFTIQYPSDWIKNEPTNGTVTVFFAIPNKNNATENLNVQVGNLSASDTLESITSAQIAHVQGFGNFTQIEAGNTTLAGNPAYKMVYTATYEGDFQKATQIWTVKDGKVYLITYKTAPDDYNTNLSAAQQMIDSFKIK